MRTIGGFICSRLLVAAQTKLTALGFKTAWLVCVLAGGLMVGSFAPSGYWLLSLISLVVFCAVSSGFVGHRLAALHYGFALGLFSVGVAWIFVSIHTYGGASSLLAGSLTGLFILLWSLTFIPQGYLLSSLRARGGLSFAPWLAVTWVLGEWFRGWFLTGFPWLYVGYGHTQTWAGHWAPIGGVLLVSFVVVLLAELLVRQWRTPNRWIPMIVTVLLIGSVSVGTLEFVDRVGSLRVAGIQANLDQHTKWQPDQFNRNLTAHTQLMVDLPEVDLVVWSEASFTRFAHQGQASIEALNDWANQAGVGLIIGLPIADETGYYNGVRGLGLAQGQYLKRHLVPFGEFVPMASVLRGLITFFDLPMSRNQPGPAVQTPIRLGSRELSLSICYEITDAELVRGTAYDPVLLITVSNDTWFGSSIGPEQHLQIASMRAAELARSLVRVTNNGVTALISHQGAVLTRLPKGEPGVMVQTVALFTGQTPYGRFGQSPFIAALFALICAALIRARVLGRKVSRDSGA